MKTGDTVQDGNGRSYQVGQILGRGLWGKTYTAREEPGGAEWVLKVPLGPEAFDRDSEQLARICREVALEQGRVLEQGGHPALIRPAARFTSERGLPVLVLPRMPSSLRARMAPGMPLEGLLMAVSDVAALLHAASEVLPVHGNLRPENILANGHGGWVLTNPATPTLLRNLPALARARGIALTWLPPEARTRHERPLSDPSVDTHALAAALLVGAMTPHDGAPPVVPDDGLDKATLVALKDGVRNRLKDEASNPRFHARLSDRLATLLNRALSRETSPSPPYRFNRADQLQQRVQEVAALVQPRVTHVGRLLLDRPPGSDAFTTDEEIAFSCSVGCTAGVETHEDIGCGIAIFDARTDERLRDVPCSYTVDRHPSGRFRFGFLVAGLEPARYRVRVAFTIRDSGGEPGTAEGELTVHPAAGYVPPPSQPEPQAIAFERPVVEGENTVTEVGPPPDSDDVGPPSQDQVSPPQPAPQPEPPPPEKDPAEDPPAPRGPRPIAPPTTSSGVPAAAASPGAPGPAAATAAAIDPSPEYRGAGRWSELPIPQTPPAGGAEPDPFAQEPTEPLDHAVGGGPLDSLLALAQGDAYKLFIGAAIAVILVLILALVALS